MSEYIVVHSVKVATEFVPQTFGRLTTIGPVFRLPSGNRGHKKSYQVCRCSCGETIIVRCCNADNGNTKSCGCKRSDRAIENGKNSKTHGLRGTIEYGHWQALVNRCGNPNAENYKDYGGRGIRVCTRWREPNGQGFINFLTDMGERPASGLSIDRHPNPDGNYEPTNCRWATDKEQARNKRNNVNITHNGKTQCLAAWEEELGLSRGLLADRMRAGWSAEKALTTPVKKYARRKSKQTSQILPADEK
jgi:hypothetical protein